MRVFISTAERSGQVYAELITEQLRSFYSGIEILNSQASDEAPIGFKAGASVSSSVIEKIRAIERRVRALKPDIFLAVAWSEPNTILGLRLRDMKGMRKLFLAPPQLWAWGRWRATLLRKGFDALYCLYPEEARFLRSMHLPAHFHGNPLVKHLTPYFDLRRRTKTVALMPGSRTSEKSRNLCFLREFRYRWNILHPGFKFTWLFLTEKEASELRTLIDSDDYVASGEDRFKELGKTSLAIVTSGTATLETALLGVPQVVFYNMSGFEVGLARLLTRVKHFALPNIIVGAEVVPELLNPSVEALIDAARIQIKAGRLVEVLTQRLRAELRAPVDKPIIPLNID